MKKLVAKLMAIAVVAALAGAFVGCDKDEETASESYIQIGDKKTKITAGLVSEMGLGSSETTISWLFFGEGLSLSENMESITGKGDLVMANSSILPGTTTVGTDEGVTGGYSSVDYDSPNEVKEVFMLAPGSKITWSKKGDIYTFDMEGSTTTESGAPGKYMKVHYVGKVRIIAATDN